MWHDVLVSYITGVVILTAGSTLFRADRRPWRTLFAILIWPLAVPLGVIANLLVNLRGRING